MTLKLTLLDTLVYLVSRIRDAAVWATQALLTLDKWARFQAHAHLP